MRQILLVEPGYRNKYPPLGLMKIARYHKILGDNVVFVKGKLPLIQSDRWDRVYVSTLFSFFWRETIETIKYYKKSVKKPKDIIVGGGLATILKNDIQDIFPDITIIPGLLDRERILDKNNDYIVDSLVPDYTILEQIDYKYGIKNAYIAYTTRGCKNKCKFCAVPQIEPKFKHYIPLKDSIHIIENEIGPQKDLLLLDNNVLASCRLSKIIKEIKELGFYKGATFIKSQRYVDFNQGLDLRRLDEPKMARLGEIALKPLRIAFDSIKYKDPYINAIKLAVKYNIKYLSNYILFNYEDTPCDFYQRLRINVEMNDQLGTKIYSFPMKYIPVYEKDRRQFIGPHWTWKMIRGVQCILNATGGVVGPSLKFFNIAFGKTFEEFYKLINMPERYIIYRLKHECDGAGEWSRLFDNLDDSDRTMFISLISSDRYDHILPTGSQTVDSLIKHYITDSK
jgi:hypothetical protein